MPSNVHSEEEWARLQPHITKLYSDEAKSLKEVMEAMERGYDFHATPRMYKHRLQKWGLDKKYKEKEVIHMSLLKKQREALGKRSIFFVRGKEVDWEQIEKYLHRRPDLKTKIRAGMLKMSSDSFDIVCRSPSPDPILHASNTLQYTDELLRLLDGYYVSSLSECPSGKRVNKVRDYAAAIRCFRRLDQARTMILANMLEPGFLALNKSLDDLKFVVRDQDATLIFYLCDVVTIFDQRHSPLVVELLRHTYGILQITFGESHPLVWLLRRLILLPEIDRYEVIATVVKAAVDKFERPGVDDRVIERLKCHYFLLLDHMASKGIKTTASFPEMDATSMDAVSVAYLGRFADRLVHSCKFEEAERKSDLMLPWLQNTANRQHAAWPDLQLFYLHVKAHGAFTRGDNKVGEAWLATVDQHAGRYFPNM
ncbi:Clr5 domain-containing protein [Dactylonectria estremocensis]|uniref:Clr5 domain-containing protein n=1 Tax=Dactylonectria estremocensis TaxID=1079267 RepID=A0A9P9JD17_9HYPO|nr:Clr5 domain-containing protein [Dactylonectria estremocensis]